MNFGKLTMLKKELDLAQENFDKEKRSLTQKILLGSDGETFSIGNRFKRKFGCNWVTINSCDDERGKWRVCYWSKNPYIAHRQGGDTAICVEKYFD